MKLLRRIYLVAVNSLFWGYFILTSMILVVGAALLRLVTSLFDPNLKILQQYTCFWSSLYLWFNPVWSLSKKGVNLADRNRTYVMVSNHQSMADILCVFNTFLHFKWVAKKELFKLPLLGWNMSLNGYIAIDRGNPKSREQCMIECVRWLKKGSSVFFFPEGSRSRDGSLQPFKPGAFHLAFETGHDILPIVIKGSLHAIPKHSRLLSGKSRMSLEILPPVSISSYQGLDRDSAVQKLTEDVRGMIAKKLED